MRKHLTRTTFVFLFFSIQFLTSCMPKEVPIAARERGEVITSQVYMNSDYSKQLYFDLENNAVISESIKTDWHIAFLKHDGKPIFCLNTALFGKVAQLQAGSYDTLKTAPDSLWRYDAPSGNLDSTAFGNLSEGNVYLVDLGVDQNGISLGSQKLEILSISEETIELRRASISGEDEAQINLALTTELQALSLLSGEVSQSIPNSTEYDIVFTQYTHLFQDPFLPYLVAGVLINRKQVAVAEVSGTSFSEIDNSIALEQHYSTNLDIIGYDWKEYDFDLAQFIIEPEKSYIIQNRNGRYYKFHFIDFYDQNGQKGAPKFEFQEL